MCWENKFVQSPMRILKLDRVGVTLHLRVSDHFCLCSRFALISLLFGVVSLYFQVSQVVLKRTNPGRMLSVGTRWGYLRHRSEERRLVGYTLYVLVSISLLDGGGYPPWGRTRLIRGASYPDSCVSEPEHSKTSQLIENTQSSIQN